MWQWRGASSAPPTYGIEEKSLFRHNKDLFRRGKDLCCGGTHLRRNQDRLLGGGKHFNRARNDVGRRNKNLCRCTRNVFQHIGNVVGRGAMFRDDEEDWRRSENDSIAPVEGFSRRGDNVLCRSWRAYRAR